MKGFVPQMIEKTAPRTLVLSLTAVFTALVAVVTAAIQVYIPQTKGYFNLGEVMVYTAAALLGARLGAVAGGVGSALADIATGYAYYAPGTLVIKGLEGFIVGLLYEKLKKKELTVRIALLASAVSAGAFFIVVLLYGYFLYTGLAEITLGVSNFSLTVTLDIPLYFWLAVAILAGLAVFAVTRKTGVPALAVAALIGGFEMVLGYFAYEYAVMNFGWAALAEVPYNIGQVIVGIIGAHAIVPSLEKKLSAMLSRFK